MVPLILAAVGGFLVKAGIEGVWRPMWPGDKVLGVLALMAGANALGLCLYVAAHP